MPAIANLPMALDQSKLLVAASGRASNVAGQMGEANVGHDMRATLRQRHHVIETRGHAIRIDHFSPHALMTNPTAPTVTFRYLGEPDGTTCRSPLLQRPPSVVLIPGTVSVDIGVIPSWAL